jgi:hypothetical protein
MWTCLATKSSRARRTPVDAFATLLIADGVLWIAHALAFALFVLTDRAVSHCYLTTYLFVKLWLAGELLIVYYAAVHYLSPYAQNAAWFCVHMQLIRHGLAALTVVLSLVWHWSVRQVVVVYCIASLVELVAFVPTVVELQKEHRLRAAATRHGLVPAEAYAASVGF